MRRSTQALFLAVTISTSACMVQAAARGGGRYLRTPSGSDATAAATVGVGTLMVNGTATVETSGDATAALFGLEMATPPTPENPFSVRIGIGAGPDFDGGRAAATGAAVYNFLSSTKKEISRKSVKGSAHFLGIGLELTGGYRFASDDDGLVAGVGLFLEYQWGVLGTL